MEDHEVITPCGLTHEQIEKWVGTTSMLMWRAGGFTHILYKLLKNHEGKYVPLVTKSIPYACTDGKNVMVNPDSYFKWNMYERTFVLGHEIVHCILGDVDFNHQCKVRNQVPQISGPPLPYRNSTMQRAMDLRINAILIQSKIGKPPKEGHYDPKMTGEENILDVYKKCYEEEGDDKQDGPGNPGGFDDLLPPGKSTGQTPQQAKRVEGTWQVEIAAAREADMKRTHGKLPASLKRMFQRLLEPDVDWTNHIATLINRVSGSGGWNYKQPDEWWTPHDFFSPRRSGKGAGWIVIWGDTSGSRSDKEITNNVANIAGMIEDVNPQRLTVLWCDAKIDYIDELMDGTDLAALHARGVGGGGGTSMVPVFDWISKQIDQPDLFIGFTDGEVSFPASAPRFPVIWASSTDKEYPFGEVVRVNRKPVRP